MASETDWVTDVRRWVHERARSPDDENSATASPQSLSDGFGELGYEAADAAVAGRYRVEQTRPDADKDSR